MTIRGVLPFPLVLVLPLALAALLRAKLRVLLVAGRLVMSLAPAVITGSGGLGLGLGNPRSGLTVLAHGLFSQRLRLDEVDGDFVEVGGGHKRRDHGGERVRDLGEEDEGLGVLSERDAIRVDFPKASDDAAHLILEGALVAHAGFTDQGLKETPDVRPVRLAELGLERIPHLFRGEGSRLGGDGTIRAGRRSGLKEVMEGWTSAHEEESASLRVLLVPLSAIISCSRTSGLSSYNCPAVHEHEEALHLGRPVRVLVRRGEDRDGVGFDVSHGEEIELGSVGEVFREV